MSLTRLQRFSGWLKSRVDNKNHRHCQLLAALDSHLPVLDEWRILVSRHLRQPDKEPSKLHAGESVAMPRLSMNELTTYRWSFEEDVSRYVQAGFNSIGVWRQKLSDFGEEKGIELLSECGLGVSNLMWAGGFTGSDGRNLQESLQDAEEAIRLAADLQASCLIVYSGTRNGHTHRHARRLVQGALRELVPLAEALDVKLAIEPMHAGCAGGWTFLTDLEDTLRLVSEIGSRHIALAFDTYHLGHDQRVLDFLPSIVDHIAIVHLGDSKQPPALEQNRCRLGDGNLPLGPMVQALCDAGYNGPFDVLLMGEEVETASYDELLLHSQQAFSELLAV